MMFIFRNEDHLWPSGHILALGDSLEDARKNARSSADYPEEVKSRILAEEPIRTFEDKD